MVKKMMPALVFILLLAACAEEPTLIQPTQDNESDGTPLNQIEPTPMKPSDSAVTVEPSPVQGFLTIDTLPSNTTEGEIPEKSLDGIEFIPLETMKKEIPWLPMDEESTPHTSFIGINSTVPPFDNPLIRKAFSLAVDRQRISDGEKSRGNESSLPATSFIPPQVLGRYLYQAVGLGYDPKAAKQALDDAGYADVSLLPKIEIVYHEGSMELVKAFQEMWKSNLGVDVSLFPIKNGEDFFNYLIEQKPGLFKLGWSADYIDPKNFTYDIFLGPDPIYPEIINPILSDLLAKADEAASDPPARQRLYIEAEKLICEDEVYIIPVTHFLIPK